MAMARSLPVIQPIPRPRIVGDCENGAGVRPCPFVSCRFSLLVDVLADGSLVINAPSSRLHGAERAIPPVREIDRQWFVELRLPNAPSVKVNAAVQGRTAARESVATARGQGRAVAVVDAAQRRTDMDLEAARQRGDKIVARQRVRARAVMAAARKRCSALKPARGGASARRRAAIVERMVGAARARAAAVMRAARARAAAVAEHVVDAALTDRGPSRVYALGPLDSAGRAEEIATAWEAEHGANTTRIHRDIPANYARTGSSEMDIDAKFLDEAEDAVEHWFDEPKPNLPSCLLDEIAKLDRSNEDCLLDGIAEVMFVSRERIRQVEEIALRKVRVAAAALGVEEEAPHG